jgi:MORN repeat
MTWQGQEYYIGDWVNGIRQGKGRSRDTKGQIKEGDWVNDKFVISQEQQQINENIRYKIKELEERKDLALKKINDAKYPTDPEEIKSFNRVRESLESDIKFTRLQIIELRKKIIE